MFISAVALRKCYTSARYSRESGLKMDAIKLGRLCILLVLVSFVLSPGSTAILRRGSIVDQVSAPYRLDLVSWEVTNFFSKWIYLIHPSSPRPETTSAQVTDVERYFSLNDSADQVRQQIASLQTDPATNANKINALKSELTRINSEQKTLEPAVEYSLEGQLTNLLAQQGITPSYLPFNLVFPPVDIKLETLPQILVISPRDRIEVIDTVLLEPGIDQDTVDAIESKIEAAGYSAVVEPLGGFATYPTMVPKNTTLDFALQVIAHEWTHNYLTFFPLGMSYDNNQDTRTINETVADMMGQELGAELKQLYKQPGPGSVLAAPATGASSSIDYVAEMKVIRLTVERMLANGEINGAEHYMEAERQYLAEHGYYLRRLNQAYLAFHGSYADAPGSVSPIGQELHELRSKSASLADFIRTVQNVTSAQDLNRALMQISKGKT